MSGMDLVQLAEGVARREVTPVREMIADGIVDAVEAGAFKASVRVGGPTAEPISGFSFSPSLNVLPGDHVLVYRLGGYQLILLVLNRNALVGIDGGVVAAGGSRAFAFFAS